MKNKIRNIVLVAFFLLCLLPTPEIRPAFAEIYLLYPTNGEVAGVSSYTPDTNYYGWVGVFHFDYNEGIAYLKYDLSSIPDHENINSVVLLASYSSLSQPSGPVSVDIYYASDNSWSATTVTWNTRPNLSAFLARSIFDETIQPTVWALSWYKYKSNLTDNYLSLAMVQPNLAGSGINFRYPFIVITTKTHKPPQP